LARRNVGGADGGSDVSQQGAVAGVRLEQATAADGRSVARVHVALSRPVDYSIKSARNTIRVDLTPRAGAPTRVVTPTPAPITTPSLKPPALKIPPQAPALQPTPEKAAPAMATLLERIRTSKTAKATTVTLVGN